MSKLGILDAHNSFTDSELQCYKAKFDHPLRPVDIEALAALFNLGIAVEAGAA